MLGVEMCTSARQRHAPCAQVCTRCARVRISVHKICTSVHQVTRSKLPGNFGKLPGNFEKLPGNFGCARLCTSWAHWCTRVRILGTLVHTACAHGVCILSTSVHISPTGRGNAPLLWQYTLLGRGNKLTTASQICYA